MSAPFFEITRNHRWSFRVGVEVMVAEWITMGTLSLGFWTVAFGVEYGKVR